MRLASKKFGASRNFYRDYNEADSNARKERMMNILEAIFGSCDSYYGHETVKTICRTIVKVVEVIVNGKKETEKKES